MPLFRHSPARERFAKGKSQNFLTFHPKVKLRHPLVRVLEVLITLR